MTGTKPALVVGQFIVVRSFRGAQLVLKSYTPAGNSFHWTSKRDEAMVLTQAEALTIADRASREYGAQCAALDADGTLLQPAREAFKQRARNIATARGWRVEFTVDSNTPFHCTAWFLRDGRDMAQSYTMEHLAKLEGKS